MNKKTATAIIALCLVFLLIGVAIGATSTSIQVIGRGNYPAAPSYTIFTDGTNYFAKNHLGTIAYSGSDAATVIQNAIDEAGDNAAVYISSGQYFIDTTLTIEAYNFTLYGDGVNSALISTTQQTLIEAIGEGTGDGERLEGLVISDLYLENYYSAGGFATIWFEYVGWSFIHDVRIYGGAGMGIYLKSSTVMRISDCIITSVSGHGIYGNVLQDSGISNCHIYGCLQTGLNLVSSGTITISGCSLDTNLYFGIDIYDSNECTIVGNQIFDNNFAGSPNIYSNIRLAADSDFNVVSANFFRGTNVQYHIKIDSGCDNNTIVANNIVRPAYTAQLINNGANNTVSLNTGYS